MKGLFLMFLSFANVFTLIYCPNQVFKSFNSKVALVFVADSEVNKEIRVESLKMYKKDLMVALGIDLILMNRKDLAVILEKEKVVIDLVSMVEDKVNYVHLVHQKM